MYRSIRAVVPLVVSAAALSLTWSVMGADVKKDAPAVTLRGKIVDLHSLMTGEYASADHAKTIADNIRAGVPVVLESSKGLYLLSHGARGAAALLAPLANQEAEIHGKSYEMKGVKYVDVSSASGTGSGEKPSGQKR